MAKIKWYKRDPDAALGGMMALTLEERGAYNTVLDLIYARDGDLHDDDRFLAGWCRCDVRVWRRIKSRLIELKKISIVDKKLVNIRATSEVDEALHRVASIAELNSFKGRKSGAVRRKNSHLDEPRHEPKTNTTTTTTTITPISPFEASITFEAFWREFPNQVKRGEAFPAYQRALTVTTHEIIMAALKKQKEMLAKEKFPPAEPAKWLRGERWADAPPKAWDIDAACRAAIL